MRYFCLPLLLALATFPTGSVWGQEAKPIALEGHTDKVYATVWIDTERVATAGVDGTIRIWSADSAELKETLSGHEGDIFALAVNADGSRLASAGKDGVIKLWDLTASVTPTELKAHRGAVYHLAFSPDGSRLASCGEDDTRILLWNLADGNSNQSLEATDPDDKNRRRSIHCVQFSPDGKQLVSCGEDRTLRLWDVDSRKEIRRFEEVEYSLFTEKDKKIERTVKKGASDLAIYTVAFSHDGRRVASGGLDKTIRVWETSTGKLLHTLSGHEDFVYDLSFTNDDAQLVSCGHAGRIAVWSLADGAQQVTVKAPTRIHAASLSPSSKRLILAGADAHGYVIKLPE